MRREISFNEVYDSQKYYRLLLDSMARPGKINMFPDMDILPPPELNKASALIAFTLLNTDVTFYVDSVNASQVSNYILLHTASLPEQVENANFIFMSGLNKGHVIGEAQVGSLPYPEEGATCVIDVISVSDSFLPDSIKLILRGPGIETQNEVYVSGLSEGILENLLAQNSEFPLGVDAIITDVNNNIVCIPRSNQFRWELQNKH